MISKKCIHHHLLMPFKLSTSTAFTKSMLHLTNPCIILRSFWWPETTLSKPYQQNCRLAWHVVGEQSLLMGNRGIHYQKRTTKVDVRERRKVLMQESWKEKTEMKWFFFANSCNPFSSVARVNALQQKAIQLVNRHFWIQIDAFRKTHEFDSSKGLKKWSRVSSLKWKKRNSKSSSHLQVLPLCCQLIVLAQFF